MVEKRFLVAMYLRLSKDDKGNGNFESNSIGNQRELIKAYIAKQRDMELYDIYTDDGFSGSNFDRPEFQRMIKDIILGRANCVIVKDLSRFGRDYVETGRYIQKVFPSLDVRFIAITDFYDSFCSNMGEHEILLPVKNFINDAYCRDISVKVKSQLEVKRKNGECIAPFVPYGYQKSKENKNQLVIDDYAAEIVKNIFEWKIDGMSMFAIAKKLNDAGVLSPKEYKKSISNYKGGFSGKESSKWSNCAVKRILTNEIYLGHLLQGKTEKISYKMKKVIEKPKEDWVRVAHTHEAIISEDMFEMVQNTLRTDVRISPIHQTNNLFGGILFCGDCREQMIRRINYNGEKYYYICSTKNRAEGCSRHSIKEEILKELVQTSLLFEIHLKSMCYQEKIGRYLLCSMIKEIFVYEDKRIEIVFFYRDVFSNKIRWKNRIGNINRS